MKLTNNQAKNCNQVAKEVYYLCTQKHKYKRL